MNPLQKCLQQTFLTKCVSAKIYSENITLCNVVYFRLCNDLMHILPPVTDSMATIIRDLPKAFNHLPNNQFQSICKRQIKCCSDYGFSLWHGRKQKRETIVGKGENAGYQHFLHFQQCFQKFNLPGSLKVRIMWQ